MGREKLFPQQKKALDDNRKPYDQFSDLASKVLRVPKSEIDKREKEWQKSRSK